MPSIKKLVENTHLIHANNVNYWNFLLNSYEGGLDYTGANVPNDTTQSIGKLNILVNGKKIYRSTNTNLFMHKKEREEDFCARIRMSYYYNFCSPIIDTYTDHLFKQPVIEKWKNIESIVEEREENIDRMHSSIDEFRHSMADLSQIYGHSYVLVDMPKANGESNLEQRIANLQFPFFVQYHPQDVLNWSLDQFGMPHWVLLRNFADGNIDWTEFDTNQSATVTYHLWTRTGWEVFDSEFKSIDIGEHSLGVVPLVCVKSKQSKKVKNFLGISDIADISFIARDIYNLTSELQEITRSQTFAFLALQGKGTNYNELSVGTNKGLLYPEGMNLPAYVSPPADNARVLMDQIEIQIDKMYQIAKLDTGSLNFKGQNTVEQSGVSKAWDFNQTNSALTKKAQNFEDGEMKLWQIFAKWENKEFDGHVAYPNEFSIQSLNDDLDEAEKLIKLNLGKMVNDEVKTTIIKKKFPRMPDENIQEFVDNMKEVPEQSEVNGNGNGRLFSRSGLINSNLTANPSRS